MKKLFILLLVILAFTGCKKDKSVDPGNKIIGKWQYYGLFGVFYFNNVEVLRDTLGINGIVSNKADVEFKSNGIVTTLEMVNNDYITKTGSYTLNNNILHMKIDNDPVDFAISYTDDNTLNLSGTGIQSIPDTVYINKGVKLHINGQQGLFSLKRL